MVDFSMSRDIPRAIPISRPAPGSPFDPEAAWDAVLRRDKAADDRFVYAVATTGVFCRPSCPSRTAKRQNVTFHPTAEAAEAAGFRPCRRCRPTEASQAERQAAMVARACRLIERAVEAGEEVPGLEDLAAGAGLSRYHFHRVFRDVAGVTPRDYAAAHRTGLAQRELREGGSITGAIYGAGYSSPSRFYETSTERLGMRPSAYRDGGRGAEIRFAVGECSLGPILVAATERGICAIQFGEDAEALVRGLQDRFPKARLLGADPGFERWVAEVVGLVEAPGKGLDLPLDVRGTAFQQRVWRALREIPVGRTATYAEVAAAIGAPKAVRAVARACAANPAAVAIPCHRVVRTDGSLSGYAWGVERKRALLDREAA